MADVATETLGGYFGFGALNGVRHRVELINRITEPKSLQGGQTLLDGVGDALRLRSKDTQTVLALLLDSRLTFRLLCGHSKGNLVISEALYGLESYDRTRAGEVGASASIVSVSAKVGMPRTFDHVVEVMRAWDWFGDLNSRADIPAEVTVPYAWHHTNTELPAHLDVTSTLRKLRTSLRAGPSG